MLRMEQYQGSLCEYGFDRQYYFQITMKQKEQHILQENNNHNYLYQNNNTTKQYSLPNEQFKYHYVQDLPKQPQRHFQCTFVGGSNSAQIFINGDLKRNRDFEDPSFNNREEQNDVEESIGQQEFRPSIKNVIEADHIKQPQNIQYRRPSLLQLNILNQAPIQLDIKQPCIYEGEVLIYTKKGQYISQNIALNFDEIVLDIIPKVFIKNIKQLKVYPEIVKGKSFKFKIVHKQTLYLGVQLKRQLYYLPQHYIWLAKIANSKLVSMGFKIQKVDGEYLLEYLSNSGTFCEGYIYKKSKYLKKWQQRYIVINTEGLFSYKSPNDNYTINIQVNEFKQMWTDFETFENNLIIKFKYKAKGHFRETLVELAIPIIDYCLRDEKNWLFTLYRIIFQHKIHIKNY